MKKRLLIINPNSTHSVTEDISQAVNAFRTHDLAIECQTLAEGPPGIVTQCDFDFVTAPLIEKVRSQAGTFDGLVVACYSDPGVNALRELLDVPVFGAARATLGYAAAISTSVGVISLKTSSVDRHNAQARDNRLAGIVAGDRPADIVVADLGEDAVIEKLMQVARDLIDKDGADTLILGCCGMSRFTRRIAQETGVVVLDPSQIAAAIAITAMQCARRT